jgi:hypothetical protein
MNNDTVVQCQCGECDGGDSCEWSGPITETVVVEYMPRSLRGSHAAARNSGSYPHNGSIRIRVHHECAERIAAEDEECEETYTYSIFDSEPDTSGPCALVEDEEFDACSVEDALEYVRNALEVEAAGLAVEDGYQAGDRIYATVWCPDRVVRKISHELTEEDLA